MDVILVAGFWLLAAVLGWRVRTAGLAALALAFTPLLAVALILQATVWKRAGAYAALGLVALVVLMAIAAEFGAWFGPGDD
jgi:hypothetical protein